GSKIAIINPETSDKSADYAQKLYRLRQAKGMTEEQAEAMAKTPLGFAAMMVREGDADGTVAGAVATTADVVRHALQIIGKAEGASLVSSFFLMLLCQSHHQKKGAFVFADCGLVVEPDSAQLADIAIQSADSYRQLTEKDAAVAMLSFSTGGSAAHERVSKVVQATRTVQERKPDLCIDGELQFDTAFVEAISYAKSPDSPLKGNANVFVFPNLEAANIGYKIAQRIGGAQAIGPVLQGLAKPANDLSRGCSADDVLHMIAITVNQAK
ncbi:phosphate acetyltransferase, partial [Brucella anthropi]|uniref:phosphate acetyltransferase n=3 Tax=Brucella/Ochrobactrum group TaxID=2826938 RepID=UPI001CFE60EC